MQICRKSTVIGTVYPKVAFRNRVQLIKHELLLKNMVLMEIPFWQLVPKKANYGRKTKMYLNDVVEKS